MRVNIMPCRFPLKDGEWPLLMSQGLKAKGIAHKFSQAPDNSDVQVFWGMRRHWGTRAIDRKLPSIICERAYLGDRHEWVSMGWNGLNGFADFNTDDVDSDRWQRYWADKMQPWRTGGDYALIIGQVHGDAALRGLNIDHWAASIASKAKAIYGRAIYRPHPLARSKPRIDGLEMSTGSLAEDLAGAAVVITYNSNTGVDAVMAGVPVVAMDKGSMAYQVSTHSLDAPLYRGDRDDWGRRIAYSQWLPSEIASGEAWQHLKGWLDE